MAHVSLSVSDIVKSRPFYCGLLQFCGLTKVADSVENPDLNYGDPFVYHVGGRTGVSIQQPAGTPGTFSQRGPGLHHFCLRLRSREDVDALYTFVSEDLIPRTGNEAKIVTSPTDGPWAPGYYYLLMEDRDGIRIEANFVPGKGLLGQEGKVMNKL